MSKVAEIPCSAGISGADSLESWGKWVPGWSVKLWKSADGSQPWCPGEPQNSWCMDVCLPKYGIYRFSPVLKWILLISPATPRIQQMLHVSDVEFPVVFTLSHVCFCTPWSINQHRCSLDGNGFIQPCFAKPAWKCISNPKMHKA